MNVLFVGNNYLKGGSGAIYASKCFINTFAEVADELTVIYPYKSDYAAEDINPKVKLIPIEDRRSKLRKFVDLCFGKIHRYGCDVTNIFDIKLYDIVVFDSSVVCFRLIKKARRAGLKCITIHHNYQVEFIKDDTPWFLMPIMLFWTYFSEREAVHNSHLNLTLTKTDSESLASHYDKNGNFEVVGVCDFIRKEYINDTNCSKETKRFIITGQLASIQTENSILPWIKVYYPILKSVCPDCELVIAGRSPSQRLINACKYNGITIIPSPVEMKPILDKGDYFICPTSLGSGLKLRNMDGLRAGMQILSHERSVRGYEEMINNGVMYSYNDQASFSQQLQLMISTPKTKQDVLDVYKGYFSFDAGIDRLREILHRNKFL